MKRKRKRKERIMVDGVTTNLLLQHTLPYKKEDPMTIQTKKKTT